MKINENEIQQIMGAEYDDVKEFFRNVIEIDCPYKVLITRRSYLLFKIFESILENENEHPLSKKGVFLNTHSIYSIPRDCKEKVLIVDDIIVNGRTVLDVIEKIYDNTSSNETISVWCIKCNVEAKYLSDIQGYLKHVDYILPYEWERFSEKLTNAIISTNIGYVSFVNSYSLENVTMDDVEGKIKSECAQSEFIICNNTSELFNAFSIKSFVLWGNFINQDVITRFKIKPCIRFYEREYGEYKKLLVIPYVFLPSLKNCDTNAYCIELLSTLYAHKEIPEELIGNDLNTTIALYKWTINEVSKKVLYNFVQKFNFNESLDVCFKCSESYAGCTKGNSIPMRNESEFEIHEQCSLTDKDGDIELCSAELEHAYVNEDFQATLSFYIKKMRELDEQRAAAKKARFRGLRVCDIMKSCKIPNEIQERKVLSEIIAFLDCGKMSYVVETFVDVESEVVIAGFLRHGEQAFKELYYLFNDVYEVFHEFFLQTKELREKELLEMAKYFDEKLRTTRFIDFVSAINFDSYFSDLMAISPRSIFANSGILDVKKVVSFYVKHYYNA